MLTTNCVARGVVLTTVFAFDPVSAQGMATALTAFNG